MRDTYGRKNNHEKEYNKIAIDNFNSTPQEGNGNENSGQDFVLETPAMHCPPEKHQDQRGPDDG